MRYFHIVIINIVIIPIALAFSGLFPLDNNTPSETGETYEKINYYLDKLNESYHSAELYFNLGNAFYSKNDYPRAKLYYEKALKLSPFNGDIKHNLEIVNRRIDSDIVAIPDYVILRFWKNFINIFQFDIWAVLSIIFAFSALILISIKWFYRSEIKLIWPVLTLLLFVFLTIVSASSHHYQHKSKWAILMHDNSLHAGPSDKSTIPYKLRAGEKMHITDSLENWFYVVLLNKERGWIEKSQVEKI